MQSKEDLKAELKLVPFMLGKFFGAAITVAGIISGGIMFIARKEYGYRDEIPIFYIIIAFVCAVIGIVIFIKSHNRINRKDLS